MDKEKCPVCLGSGSDYDYENGALECGACLGTGLVTVPQALPSAEVTNQQTDPLPSRPEPTSLADDYTLSEKIERTLDLTISSSGNMITVGIPYQLDGETTGLMTLEYEHFLNWRKTLEALISQEVSKGIREALEEDVRILEKMLPDPPDIFGDGVAAAASILIQHIEKLEDDEDQAFTELESLKGGGLRVEKL